MIDGTNTDNYPEPAEPFARLAAKAIDVLLAMMVGQVAAPWGMLLGLVYLLAADGMAGGQSLGKRALSLRVIQPETGATCTVRQSVLRNADLGLLYFLLGIPLLGTVLAVILGIFILAVEVHAVFRDRKGLRMGDLLAGTEVVGEIWQRLDQPAESGAPLP